MMAPNYREAGLQRRALFGLLPDGASSSSSSSASSTGTAANAANTNGGGGGLVGGLTSAIGDVTSAVGGAVPSLAPSPTSSSSSSTSTSSTSSVSSTSSTSKSASSTSSSSSTSASTASTTSTSSSSATTSSVVSTSAASTTAAPETTPQPVSQDETTTYLSTSNDQVLTVTATLPASDLASSASASPSATQAGTHQSFLQNKPLSGTIFALVGLVALVIIVVISTWFVRRARKNRLERDAETFAGVFPDPDGLGGGAFTGEKLARSPSGRTAHTNMSSDEALIGGYGHRRQLSDGTIDQRPQMQMQQGPGGFNPLPAPPGLTGARPHPGVPPMPSYAYESPYAAYQQPAYMPPSQQQQQALQRAPTNGSAWNGASYGQQQQPGPMPQMQPQQAQQHPARNVNNSPSPTRQRPPSVFGTDPAAAARASSGSDAYADYAFATGPGQQGAGPRNLTIANV